MAAAASRPIQIALAGLLALETLAFALQLGPHWPFGDAFASWTTPVLLVGMVAAIGAIVSGNVRARRWVGAAFLLGGAGMAANYAAGWRPPVGPDLWGDARYAAMIAIVLGTAAVGTLARRRWARWIAVGLGAGGLVSAGLNLVPAIATPDWHMWVLACSHVGAGGLALCLAGPEMAAEDHVGERESLWTSTDPLVRRLRLSIVAAIVAVPMLLLYAWSQAHVDPQVAEVAPWLAVFLALSAFGAVRGKVWGGLGLALSGVALAASTAAGFAWAASDCAMDIAGYYACFWGPASVVCMMTGLSLLRALWSVRRG